MISEGGVNRKAVNLFAGGLGTVLALSNLRHLHDPSLDWVLRYGSIAWALLAIVNFAQALWPVEHPSK